MVLLTKTQKTVKTKCLFCLLCLFCLFCRSRNFARPQSSRHIFIFKITKVNPMILDFRFHFLMHKTVLKGLNYPFEFFFYFCGNGAKAQVLNGHHGCHRVNGSDFNFIYAKFLYNDIAGKHGADFIFHL